MAFSIVNEGSKRPTTLDFTKNETDKKFKFMSPYSETSASNDSISVKNFSINEDPDGCASTKRSDDICGGGTASRDVPDGGAADGSVDYLNNPLILKRSFDLTRSGAKRVDIGLLLREHPNKKKRYGRCDFDEEMGLKFEAVVQFRDTEHNNTVAMSAKTFCKFVDNHFKTIKENLSKRLTTEKREFEVDGIFVKFIVMHNKFGIIMRRGHDIKGSGERCSIIMLDTTVMRLMQLKEVLYWHTSAMECYVPHANKCFEGIVQEIVRCYCFFDSKYWNQPKEVVKGGNFDPLEFLDWSSLGEAVQRLGKSTFYTPNDIWETEFTSTFKEIILFYKDYIRKPIEDNVFAKEMAQRRATRERLI